MCIKNYAHHIPCVSGTVNDLNISCDDLFDGGHCRIAIEPASLMSFGVTFRLLIAILLAITVGVMATMDPIPWNVPFPSMVHVLWSALSAIYWRKAPSGEDTIEICFASNSRILLKLDYFIVG